MSSSQQQTKRAEQNFQNLQSSPEKNINKKNNNDTKIAYKYIYIEYFL
jgi:hypothetical protein